MSTKRPTAKTLCEPGAILFGQTRRGVLGWLFGHPDEAFYLRQIVRLTGAAQGAVQRELNALGGAGLVIRTVQGKQVYFRANRGSPIFPELQSLLVKTCGVVDVLRDALIGFAPRIVAALVFGSAARGELGAGSDIDLLVVGEVGFAAVVEALQGAQERIGREVNPSIFPPEEFRRKIGGGDHFLKRVLEAPHLFVIGGPDDLGRLGAERLVDPAFHKRGGDRRASRRGGPGPGGQRR